MADTKSKSKAKPKVQEATIPDPIPQAGPPEDQGVPPQAVVRGDSPAINEEMAQAFAPARDYAEKLEMLIYLACISNGKKEAKALNEHFRPRWLAAKNEPLTTTLPR